MLLKEIGTDALFALQRVVTGGEEAERVLQFHEYASRGDLALAVAQTDVKGDRSAKPSAQEDPDMYVHIVDRSSDGIVVRGAKVHTSCTPNVDEVIVIPTRALSDDERDWAVAFSLPVATPGIKLFCSDYLHGGDDPWALPISSQHKMVETLTVFDDVFVPWDRVFLDGDTKAAGRLALTFVEYHRLTAVSYKLPLLDALVGLAFLARCSEWDPEGLACPRQGDLADRICRVGARADPCRGRSGTNRPDHGDRYPDPMTTNIAKWTFARDYYQAVEHVVDLAGGCLSPAWAVPTGTRHWCAPTSRSTSLPPPRQTNDSR